MGGGPGIEELTIQPGRERSILIWYTPAVADEAHYSSSAGGAAAVTGGGGVSGGGGSGGAIGCGDGGDEDPEVAALVSGDGEGGGAMGAMRLARRTFSVDLRGRTRALGRETLSRSVACRARVCVSRIAVRVGLGEGGACGAGEGKSVALADHGFLFAFIHASCCE